MGTLWTPSGEHPVGNEPAQEPPAPPPPDSTGGGGTGRGAGGGESDQEEARQLEELRRQLAATPVEVVVANHCFGLFELAGVYLSQPEPQLEGAQVAIDALGALVEGLAGRLGQAEPTLRDALAQLRLAFVQISGAQEAGGAGASSS